MRDTNEMEIQFDSKSCNEGFARVAVASFLTQMNPTVEEVADVKTAVSEAVTMPSFTDMKKRQERSVFSAGSRKINFYGSIRQRKRNPEC